jgi:hypothetical protein
LRTAGIHFKYAIFFIDPLSRDRRDIKAESNCQSLNLQEL